MVSDPEKRVFEFLVAEHVSFVIGIKFNPISQTVVLTVMESAIDKKAGKEKTSHRQLASIGRKVEAKLGIKVEFLIVNSRVHEEVEAGLNALLALRFKEAFANCFVSSLEKEEVDVWIEPGSASAASILQLHEELTQAITDYLRLLDLRLREIHLGDFAKVVPTPVDVLKATKIIGPVLADEIFDFLRAKQMTLPSDSWVRVKLDQLRKHGLVLRRQDGRYLVTSAGLAAIPHRKGNASTDVERALVFSRKKW